MAEEEDKSQKTEEPSQKKLEDARKKGQVATSRELNNALMISSAAAFVALLTPSISSDLTEILVPFISAPHSFIISISDLHLATHELLKSVGIARSSCRAYFSLRQLWPAAWCKMDLWSVRNP